MSKKKYSRPKKPFDKARIEEEAILKKEYGLKNKKEIWKADSYISRIRNLAKELITSSEDEKNEFINRLQKKGFEVVNLADALGLNKEDLLKRRLQTIVLKKGLANTISQARQFVVHKHVSINGNMVNIPSYIVSRNEETVIELNLELKQKFEKSRINQIKKDIEGVEKVPEEIAESEEEIAEEVTEKSEEINQEVLKDEIEIDKKVTENLDINKNEKKAGEKAKEIDEKLDKVNKEIEKEADKKAKEIVEEENGN